jgi:hypothetical protein
VSFADPIAPDLGLSFRSVYIFHIAGALNTASRVRTKPPVRRSVCRWWQREHVPTKGNRDPR